MAAPKTPGEVFVDNRCNGHPWQRELLGEPPPLQLDPRIQLRQSREFFTRDYDLDRVPADDAAVDAALAGLYEQVSHGHT